MANASRLSHWKSNCNRKKRCESLSWQYDLACRSLFMRGFSNCKDPEDDGGALARGETHIVLCNFIFQLLSNLPPIKREYWSFRFDDYFKMTFRLTKYPSIILLINCEYNGSIAFSVKTFSVASLRSLKLPWHYYSKQLYDASH